MVTRQRPYLNKEHNWFAQRTNERKMAKRDIQQKKNENIVQTENRINLTEKT